uniref:Putative secreted protein n=1 Tax=Anopheles darlingi TaxID=43151 RepID=A0A2M4DPK8_ANODA
MWPVWPGPLFFSWLVVVLWFTQTQNRSARGRGRRSEFQSNTKWQHRVRQLSSPFRPASPKICSTDFGETE